MASSGAARHLGEPGEPGDRADAGGDAQEGRERAVEGLECMGIRIDHEKNAKVRGEEARISPDDSKVQVWVIPTNEELAIARDTLELSTKK